MTSGSALLGVALLILAAVFLLRPFITARRLSNPNSVRHAYLDQKEALLEQIRQLEFDYETGKLPEPAYIVERKSLVQRAALVLRQLDLLGVTSPDDLAEPTAFEARGADSPDVEAQDAEAQDAEIEAAIAAARARSTASSLPPVDAATPLACRSCGTGIQPGDKFCARCGAALATPHV